MVSGVKGMEAFFSLAKVTLLLYSIPMRLLMSEMLGMSLSACVRVGVRRLVETVQLGLFFLYWEKLFSYSYLSGTY